MKKLIFSLAGVALVAGTALAFTTTDNALPECGSQQAPPDCTEFTDDPDEACCVIQVGTSTEYRKLPD